MNISAITIIIGGLATLGIFTFLWKENKVFRFWEHLFIGISAGIGPVIGIKTYLWPEILEPMLGMNRYHFPDGSYSEPYQPLYLLYIIPVCFGLLYYAIYSRQHAWLANIVIGFSLGFGSTLGLQGFFAEMIPQLTSSAKPLVVYKEGNIDFLHSINNCVFLLILFSVLYFFSFTFKRTSKSGNYFASFGKYSLMVCFGAFFGSTVMARLALLVDRIRFLLEDWVTALLGL